MSYVIFIFSQGEQGLPGLGLPGLKGERVSADKYLLLCFISLSLSVKQTKLPESLPSPRASAVFVSHLRLAAGLPLSKCLMEQETSQANRALKGHPDLQVLELMANRWDGSSHHKNIYEPKSIQK